MLLSTLAISICTFPALIPLPFRSRLGWRIVPIERSIRTLGRREAKAGPKAGREQEQQEMPEHARKMAGLDGEVSAGAGFLTAG